MIVATSMKNAINANVFADHSPSSDGDRCQAAMLDVQPERRRGDTPGEPVMGSLRQVLDADRRDLRENELATMLSEPSAMLLPFVLAVTRLAARRDVLGDL